jgi:TetR/AcrR family transcriptional regulator, regulator of cefoperazone and chloramphenicol sensitivity
MKLASSTAKGEAEAPQTAAGGYRKGAETRLRILTAALHEFGTAGAVGATTRKIAQEAGVSLPALTYYFGGKEGLYLACAREIVREYQAHMLAMLADVRISIDEGASPDTARASLKAVIGALVDLQIAHQQSDVWMSFVLREISEQGPAFGLLFEQLWSPGADLIVDLISRITGAPPRSTQPRLQALLLVSSLTAFSLSRPISLKYLGWPRLSRSGIAEIKAVLEQQIDQIAAAP